MTRKDYIALAATLARVRASYAPHWDLNLFRACDDHAVALADMLGENPRFDRVRFLDEARVPAYRVRLDTIARKCSRSYCTGKANCLAPHNCGMFE